MATDLPGWSHAELVEQVVVAPRTGFVPAVDTELRVRPGWIQIITPSFRQGGLNEVGHCALPADEIEAAIEQALADFRRPGLRFRWTIAIDSRPLDLAARLLRRGLIATQVIGMARLTTVAVPPVAGITVEAVGPATVDTFTEVMAAGWACDPAPLRDYHRRVLADPDQRTHMFVARASGAVIAAGSSNLLPRSVYLQGAVVLPAWRGRGAYRALIAARLAHAAERGRTLATTHARATSSAPILARLGFTAPCPLLSFADPAP